MNQKTRIDVCLTIDVEFNINSTLHRQGDWFPVGEESVARLEHGESQGLGFILTELQRANLKATFFVEVLNVSHFGDEPIRRVIRSIEDAGQDVQLHLHGCWNYFNDPEWRDKALHTPPHERYDDWSVEEVSAILETGINIFKRLTGRRPSALRMGSLQTHATLHPAMERVGLLIGSNIGVAISPPKENDLFLLSGAKHIGQVLEIPVTAYQDYGFLGKSHLKNLTVIGSSWAETRGILRQAEINNLGPVVLLSHASEFSFEKRSPKQVTYRKNRIGQRRFTNLCEYLCTNADKFRTTTISECASECYKQDNPTKLLKAPIVGVLRRMWENNVVQKRHYEKFIAEN